MKSKEKISAQFLSRKYVSCNECMPIVDENALLLLTWSDDLETLKQLLEFVLR